MLIGSGSGLRWNIDVHHWFQRRVHAVWHALRGLCQLPYIQAVGYEFLYLLHRYGCPVGQIYWYMDLLWPINTPLDRGRICGSHGWSRWGHFQCRRVGASRYSGFILFDSHFKQAIWTRIFLNGGIDPSTNTTIIPSAEFDVVTSAHSIANANASAQTSTEVYGIGWGRLSFLGHDVSESCPFYPVYDMMFC